MLRRYKNELFHAIERAGLEISDFESEEINNISTGEPVFTVTFRENLLKFVVLNSDPNHFQYWHTKYAPGFLNPFETDFYPPDYLTNFTELLKGFEKWLKEECLTAIEDELLPDLWSQIPRLSYDQGSIPVDGTLEFSTEERSQIKLSIDNFRLLIINNFSPSKEQLTATEKQLEYLKDAVDRLNRFDWRGVLISTLLGISTTLYLDTEKGRQLYGLFQQAFSALSHLLK